jgi:hypothetical protein
MPVVDAYLQFVYVQINRSATARLSQSMEVSEVETQRKADISAVNAEQAPSVVGLRVIWTKNSHRRKGIAARLVGTVCSHHIYGRHINKRESDASRQLLAFSQPTDDGKQFAFKFTDCEEILVY